MTPSAVSQQIRSLEMALGQPLFIRGRRHVAFTEAGATFFRSVSAALDELRRATEALREPASRRKVRLSADAAVAYEVVIPGMRELASRHPEIDVSVETSSSLADLSDRSIDAGVRLGRGAWSGLESKVLAEMQVAVVAAPSLLCAQQLRSPGDLAKCTLLEVAGTPDHWSVAAAELGFHPGRRVLLDSYFAKLQAAAHGAGVALALFPLSNSWVDDGRLSTIFSVKLGGPFFFSFVYRADDRGCDHLTAVVDWLRRRFALLQQRSSRAEVRSALCGPPPSSHLRQRRL